MGDKGGQQGNINAAKDENEDCVTTFVKKERGSQYILRRLAKESKAGNEIDINQPVFVNLKMCVSLGQWQTRKLDTK